MNQDESRYLGRENIGKLLRKFAIPCIISLIVSCLYNIVDQIFVGNGIGYLGNAATGIIFPITVVGWGLSLFFGDGAAAYLSVSLGERKTEKISASVGNAVLFSFVSGVAVAAVGYIFGDRLLTLLGATGETLPMAREYGFIIYAMLPFALAQNCLAAIIRADGNPRFALATMLVGAMLNIIGDPIAIFALGMGIKGAAYATIFGQFVSFLMCALYLKKSRNFKLSVHSFKPEWAVLKRIMALGTSSFLTQLSIVVITIVNNVLLVKFGALSQFGADIPLSAFVVIMKLFQIVLNIAIGIAVGAQPIVGYNYGSHQMDRVRQLFRLILKYTTLVCLAATALFEVIPGSFIRLFGSADNALYTEFAISCLRIYLSLILFTCLQKVCAIFLQSIGNAKLAAPLSLLRDLLLIVVTLWLPGKLGVTGVFWAAPIADVLALLVTVPVMIKVYKSLDGVPARAKIMKQTQTGGIAASHPGTIVTIARQHGSAGRHIAQLVAERMKVKCYYKEMIALAAEESGLNQEFISDINRNTPTAMKELYLTTAPVQQAILAQNRIINRIADAGSCVIVGRAADYILSDRNSVVRVFIYAPEAYRIKRIQESYGDSAQEAAHNIHRADDARSNYYETITHNKWGAFQNYELCIDSSLGIENTVNAICAYIDKKSGSI